jgi:hypothetical protein
MRRLGDRVKLSAGLLIVVLFCTTPVRSQTTRPASIGDALEVTLLTIGPGTEAYEAFGHNALIIRNTINGASAAYNYGVFNFDQENFYWRFIQGRMLYTMAIFPVGPMIDDYIAHDRTVYEQVLNLSGDQKLALLDYLENNARPQNRDYLYDYYRNNCSTKVRDALDAAGVLDGQIHQQTAAAASGTTYRWHTRRLTVGTPPLYVALEAVLGRPVDRPISRWEEMFLPGKLRDYVRDATVVNEAGQAVALLKSERLLHQSGRYVERSAARNVAWKYLLAGLVFGGILLALGTRLSSGRWARIIWGAMAVLWMAVAGLGGAIGAWGWFFTDHAAAASNENLLTLNVLLIALIVLTPPALARRHRGLRLARLLALIVAAMAVVALLLKALPFFYQYNWDILALSIPIHLSIAWTLWRLASHEGNRSQR